MTNMIRYSSNEDATRVLGWVGADRLLEILQSERYRFYDAGGKGGLWVGKSYGKDAAYRRDPIGNLSHGATAFQVARLYYLLAGNTLLSPLAERPHEGNPVQPRDPPQVRQGPGEPARACGSSASPARGRTFHADSALVEYGDRRYVMVGLAEHADGGDWLMRLAAPLHDLVVVPARTASAAR